MQLLRFVFRSFRDIVLSVLSRKYVLMKCKAITYGLCAGVAFSVQMAGKDFSVIPDGTKRARAGTPTSEYRLVRVEVALTRSGSGYLRCEASARLASPRLFPGRRGDCETRRPFVMRRIAKPCAASVAERVASRAISSSVECVALSTSMISLTSNDAKSAMKPPRMTCRRNRKPASWPPEDPARGDARRQSRCDGGIERQASMSSARRDPPP